MKKIQKILIIDDDPVSLYLSQEASRKLFIAEQVITCRTAFQALLYIKENCLPTLINQDIYCPELLLVDINMPGINGYEFLAELYSIEDLRHNQTCIVLISGTSYEQEKEKVKHFPVLGYIEKPVTTEKLMDLLYKPKNKLSKSN